MTSTPVTRLFALATMAMLIWPCAAVSGDRLALLVGNGEYPHDATSDLRLPGSVPNVKAFANYLLSVGYEKRDILLRLNASRRNFLGALAELEQRAEREHPSQITLFYSGHGTTAEDGTGLSNIETRDEGPDDLTDEALLMIFNPRTVASVEDTMVRDDELFQHLQRLYPHTKQLVVIIDACFGGGVLKGDSRQRPHLVTEAELGDMLRRYNKEASGLRSKAIVQADPRLPELETLAKLNSSTQMLFIASADQTEEAVGPSQESVGTFMQHLLAHLRHKQESSPDQLLANLSQNLKNYTMTPRVLTHNLTRSESLISAVFGDAKDVPTAATPWPARQVSASGNVAPTLTQGTGWQTIRGLSWSFESLAGNVAEDPAAILATDCTVRVSLEPYSDLWLYLVYLADDGSQQLLNPYQQYSPVGNLVISGWLCDYRLTLQADPRDGHRPPYTERLRLIAAPERLDEAAWKGARPLSGKSFANWQAALDSAALRRRPADSEASAPELLRIRSAAGAEQLLLASPRAADKSPLVVDFELRHAPR